ncbi:hypothetical protein [Streptoalloteichus hindustanus]|uniref:Methyltransferase domain-containing protein n=1 Tax=Streptoalloteichus hindustanus TaxID=2017 RepID=A0A1M5MQX1_STRHI|nr:hypothetical protein [Streptoalloteichus hindustanus]SHG79698.1 hypothetical protein SAMN05444320_11414 [Streptoalloteichus hindustanus]
MITPSSAAVVASYDGRARFGRTEVAAVRRPRLLRGLLATAAHVAEIPCGAGHFLSSYARTSVAATLVDASAAMLATAVEHAVEVGQRAERTFPMLAYWQEVTLPEDVDLVVVPNAALNQLACQAPLTDLLACLRVAASPGTEVLAQVACTHRDGGVDTATFYDPARQHRVWFADRGFKPTQTSGAVLRRRRQHRDGNRLHIEFDYRDGTGTSMHSSTVELELFTAARLAEAFTSAGFGHVRFLPGEGGLSEVLATAEGGDRL